MSVALLDVNVLMALFDPSHVHFEAAHGWFRTLAGSPWATCPITVNGCLRTFSQPRYERPRVPWESAKMLQRSLEHPTHEFWPDSASILDESLFDLSQVQSGKQLTDIYLLGLAVRRGGHLVTLDRSIPWRAVIGATASHLKILGGPGPR